MSFEIFIELQKSIGSVLNSFCIIKTGCTVGIKRTAITLLKCFSEEIVVSVLIISRTAG